MTSLPVVTSPLHLDPPAFRELLLKQGPSLGLWRAAEVAALRQHDYRHPVLDVGCGDGQVTSLVLARVEIGLDPDHTVLARAARTGVYGRLQAVCAEEAGIDDGSVATVICNSVLEHLKPLEPVIRSVARVLEPKGRFVFTAPTDAFARWLALPVTAYARWRNVHLLHFNLWSARQWSLWLGSRGFVVESVRPYLRRPLVLFWDLLDLLEQVWVARRRVLGVVWRRLPLRIVDGLARAASRLDLSAPYPGGGQVIVARKNA